MHFASCALSRNFFEPYAIMSVKSATAQVASILEKLKVVKFDIQIRDRNLDNHKLWETYVFCGIVY